jgi:hypothetical protein
MDEPNYPAITDQVCRKCAGSFPKTDFRIGNVGSYSCYCKKCQKLIRAENAVKELAKRKAHELREGTKEITKTISAPHISELAEAMVKKFGGLEQFVDEWYQDIRKSEAGSKTRLDSYNQIKNMIEASTIHRMSAPDVLSLTDKQLELERTMLIMEMIAENPDSEHTETIMKLLENGGDVIDVDSTTITTDRERAGSSSEESTDSV